MQKIYFLFLLQVLTITKSFTQSGQWIWMKGDTTINSDGVFGVKGIPDPANKPPALYETFYWTDQDGNFWLFGGVGGPNYQEYAALWKFDPLTNEWTWINGPSAPQQTGVYGTLGIPSSANHPGGRAWGGYNWIDTAGNLWLYGGSGYSSTSYGYMGDLWRYNIATNEWTWMHGSDDVYPSAEHGILLQPDPQNTPGTRVESGTAWRDDENNLWLFGGEGLIYGYHYNDVWKFDPLINEWTWMHGSTGFMEPIVSGAIGEYSNSYTPGGRRGYSAWVDNDGKFWLYGGMSEFSDYHADMWAFDPDSLAWAYMGGTFDLNVDAIAGNACEDSTLYHPVATFENKACLKDSCGQFWYFGGFNIWGSSNDLWLYTPDTKSWAWINGSLDHNPPGFYGQQGVANPSNMPAGSGGNAFWKDHNGNLWLFGGFTYYGIGAIGPLWKYIPDPSCALKADCALPPAPPGFVASDTNVCEKFCIDFTDSSQNNPTSWLWLFPGGDPSSSTQQNPSNVCYNLPGVYDVTLITTSNSGIDTFTLTDFITVYATPAFPTITQVGDTLISSVAAGYQWQFNSVDIPGATNQQYVVSGSGLYTIIISDENGCTNSTSVFVDATGISLWNDDIVVVYPNPTHTYFTLSTTAIAEHSFIYLYDVIGRKIASYEVDDSELRVGETISAGIFFLQIQLKDGTGKVIKLVKTGD